MKTQLTIAQLEEIIRVAKNNLKYDSSLSDTVEITVLKSTDCHTGSDIIEVEQKSSYAECMGCVIHRGN